MGQLFFLLPRVAKNGVRVSQEAAGIDMVFTWDSGKCPQLGGRVDLGVWDHGVA